MSLVVDSKINVVQEAYQGSHLDYEVQPPQNNGQPLSLNTSRTPVVIQMPATVWNPYQSYLPFRLTVPGTVDRYIWYRSDVWSGCISQLQYYTSATQNIIDLDNLQNYLQNALKMFTSQDELKLGEPKEGFYPSGVLKNQVPALKPVSVAGGGPNVSTLDYLEPAYYQCTALGADLVLDFQLPLRLLKGTIFADNHNFYAGNISFLKLFFGPLDKIGYFSTSNAHPSAGARTVLNTAATITNLNLYSAVEKNDAIANAKMAEIAAGKEMYINSIFCNKVSNQGVNQSIPVLLSNGQGSYLNWIMHSVYNNAETLDTAYDNNNDDSDATMNLAKVQQFSTSIGGRQIQALQMDTTTATGQYTDWLQMKRLMKGSCISSHRVYRQNWFFFDDFSNFSPEHMQSDSNNLIAGRPLESIPISWSFNGKVMATAGIAFQHYTWACITKKIRFQAGQVLVL